MNTAKLILLFDGGCPFCQREVSFLRSKDSLNLINFVDIDSPNYSPDLFKGISYREAMGKIHAITSSGEILQGVQVFREAYKLIGWAWIYAPTNWPVIGAFVDTIYEFWANWRLFLTARPSLDKLCKLRDNTSSKED